MGDAPTECEVLVFEKRATEATRCHVCVHWPRPFPQCAHLWRHAAAHITWQHPCHQRAHGEVLSHVCVCVQLGQGFHKQAKHFNSTTPPQHQNTTPVGFEPTRGDPIGLAGRRLNRSAKVSLASQGCFILKPNETAHTHFTPSTTSKKRIGAVLLTA